MVTIILISITFTLTLIVILLLREEELGIRFLLCALLWLVMSCLFLIFVTVDDYEYYRDDGNNTYKLESITKRQSHSRTIYEIIYTDNNNKLITDSYIDSDLVSIYKLDDTYNKGMDNSYIMIKNSFGRCTFMRRTTYDIHLTEEDIKQLNTINLDDLDE